MSTDKSKAARIADELEYKGQRGIDPWASELSEAVAELRRRSASEAALLAALEMAAGETRHPDYDWPVSMSREISDLIARTKESRNG